LVEHSKYSAILSKIHSYRLSAILTEIQRSKFQKFKSVRGTLNKQEEYMDMSKDSHYLGFNRKVDLTHNTINV